MTQGTARAFSPFRHCEELQRLRGVAEANSESDFSLPLRFAQGFGSPQ